MQASATARATLSRWYWAVPYLAVTVLALSMLAVVWLLQARETTVERDALARSESAVGARGRGPARRRGVGTSAHEFRGRLEKRQMDMSK